MIKLIECLKTWQGEGPDTGKQVLLLRFKRCNMKCSFCDTRVRMNNSIEGNYSLEDIKKVIEEFSGLCGNRGLLITGGEPTIYNLDILNILQNIDYGFVNIETNGYKLKELIDLTKGDKYKKVKFIYSPKKYNKSEQIPYLDVKGFDDERVYYKILVEDKLKDSVDSTLWDMTIHGFDMNKVYLMPVGTTSEELKKNSPLLFDLAEKYKCNISSRLHLIYNFI